MGSGESPERLLSAALRAQASGGTPTARPGATQVTAHRRLPVLPIIVFAAALGLVAGVVVGVLSLL
ncbi:hypothetical protein GIY23_21815 [Allosaccharopolyspora coralli]|uniref:Uncharacterized protein n=1 Tax=Allosaccharopolyspora coralli TaxID=2665642 RepID=A0A5Q3QD22_9PSEU|nr:hypothetical protein [Allosaccharopolyspora coralli]QGK71800.1 hypothetical protein GIY23_21815 [Allosaccharopolyspora coralli]